MAVRAATWIAVGITSLDDWPAFTWSLGCTGSREPSTPPSRSMARFDITSLAFHTAAGRIQLGYLGEEEIWRRLKSTKIEYYTPATIIDLQALATRVVADRNQGFSIVDEECICHIEIVSIH